MTARLRPVIAIDGPSGVGKSTLAARLAQSLNFMRLDTGAMYRALALDAMDQDNDFGSAAEMTALANRVSIKLEPATHSTRVLLNGRDVSTRIRDADVTQAASRISVHPGVRAWMAGRQQAMGKAGGIVMEGRDIGTVVFPDAEIKLFLDADERVRGERRYQQQFSSDATRPQPDAQETLRLIHERDASDRTRAASPLMPAEDAVFLDTTALDLDQVLAKALNVVRERFPDLPIRNFG